MDYPEILSIDMGTGPADLGTEVEFYLVRSSRGNSCVSKIFSRLLLPQ